MTKSELDFEIFVKYYAVIARQTEHWLYANYSMEAIKEIKKECKQFLKKNLKYLKEIEPSVAGELFWLARNKKGGFPDDKVTESAVSFGSLGLEMSSRGKLHFFKK